MPAEYTYDYAIVRVVPRVERGEQINVGVILSCVDDDFLQARIEVDPARLLALDPALDVDEIQASLATIPAICRGGDEAGPIGALPARGRFRWLVSPRSTIIQMSPVHTGRTHDPEAALERLLETMVRQPPAEAGSHTNCKGQQLRHAWLPASAGRLRLISRLAIAAPRWSDRPRDGNRSSSRNGQRRLRWPSHAACSRR